MTSEPLSHPFLWLFSLWPRRATSCDLILSVSLTSPNFISYPLPTQNLPLPFYPSSPYPPDELVQVLYTSRSPWKSIPWNTPGSKLQRYPCACRFICDRMVYQQVFWRRCEFSNDVRNANKLSGTVAGER
jgi:hypothetical protein